MGATLCPCNNANYIIHERILHIYRSCIHFSIGTDGQHLLPMENWFTIGTDRTDGQGFGGLPYALAIMLTTSFTKGFCTFTDRVFISPSVPTDNFDLPMDNWFTICTDRTDGQGFWGATLCPCNNANYLIHERILYIYRSCIHSPSVPTDNFDLPMDNWFTICTDRTDGQGFWAATLCPCNNANYLIHERILHIYRSCIHSPSVPTDNFDLPMDNWFTICTDRTDGQGFWGLPYALAIVLTTSFTKGFCTFTDRVFISPSVPTDNFDLPMENWFTIGTDRTDGQGFWGLPYAFAIMLTTSFTKGFCTFTDRVFILHPYRRTTSIYRWTIGLPSVPTVPMDKVFGGLPVVLARGSGIISTHFAWGPHVAWIWSCKSTRVPHMFPMTSFKKARAFSKKSVLLQSTQNMLVLLIFII